MVGVRVRARVCADIISGSYVAFLKLVLTPHFFRFGMDSIILFRIKIQSVLEINTSTSKKK